MKPKSDLVSNAGYTVATVVIAYIVGFALICLDSAANTGICRSLPRPMRHGLEWVYYPVFSALYKLEIYL